MKTLYTLHHWFALVAFCSTIHTAFAFYNPETGRWLSRDPIEESAVINLYDFVNNNPTSFSDKDGRQVILENPADYPTYQCPFADPCAEAKRRGMDKGQSGGVVCCGLKAYPCVWKLPSLPSGPGYGKATEIFKKCVLAHERTHIPKNWACGCGFHIQKAWRWAEDEDECEAYYTELMCLRSSLSECFGERSCEAGVRAIMLEVAKNVVKYCGAVNE